MIREKSLIWKFLLIAEKAKSPTFPTIGRAIARIKTLYQCSKSKTPGKISYPPAEHEKANIKQQIIEIKIPPKNLILYFFLYPIANKYSTIFSRFRQWFWQKMKAQKTPAALRGRSRAAGCGRTAAVKAAAD